MKKTISYTMPVIIPDNPNYKNVHEDAKKGREHMHELLEDGWTIKTVSSATTHETIYNTYILEK